MHINLSFREQQKLVMDTINMLVDLFARAEKLGINPEGKNRAELLGEIQQVEDHFAGTH